MKIALKEKELLEKANGELAKMPWFEDGMQLLEPKMHGGMLVMMANGMTNAAGVVRADLIEKFDTFAKSFADRYTLA
ncbi:hypothetical protein I5Q49_09290 [Pseudomonas carnis]|uniref:hypothetical protein n=1 Tax=Pseudomonas carnis TaxID=2487355 RepID=UPI0018D72D13|nr:hypothetical protein [Pseudomonas carnis]MBH3465039.1 hypothetical protein [Pseudomonas carnis]